MMETGGSLVLASPYISRGIPALGPSLPLATLISRHCNEVTIIFGTKFSSANDYLGRFADFHGFAEELQNLVASHVTVQPRQYQGQNKFLHAKIALRILDNKVVAGVIGSSNLTHPAWSDSSHFAAGSQNCETDVLLWDSRPAANRHFRQFPYERYDGGGDAGVGRRDLSPFPDLDLELTERRAIRVYATSEMKPHVNRDIRDQLQNIYDFILRPDISTPA